MIPKSLILSDKIRKALDLPQVINITDQLPRHPTKKWPKRNFNLLQGMTIHHFASEAPILNQANYHITSHGWVGIAYTIIVRDGQILQTNYLDDRTSHASGGNDISWGICIGGDLSKRPMADFEHRAISGVCLALMELKEDLWVKGHNQISSTACPCTNMDVIRSEIMTAGLKLEVTETPNDMIADAVKVSARVSDLYKVATSPGKFQLEANRKMKRIAEMMKAEGLL